MRTTSAIGRSASELERRTAVNRLAVRSSTGGFTLVEVMVVLVIIALITGSALLSFGLVGGASGAARDVERLQSRLLAARERAELENRDYGVRLLPDGYEFLIFDPLARRWLTSDDRSFGTVRWSLPLAVELDVDGRRVVLRQQAPDDAVDTASAAPVAPDFGVDPSGEFTAFELRLATLPPATRYRLGLDDAGELRLQEERAQ
jgi:type II secretion system protein H